MVVYARYSLRSERGDTQFPVDRIWGIGLAQDDEKTNNPNLWRGLNLLGFALMRVRDAA